MLDKKIDALQGLRAIAALLVVIAHAILTLMEKAGYERSIEPIAEAAGDIGVKIFFLISGFIMTFSMYDNFGKSAVALDFLRKRIIRVVPLYWLATTIYVLKLSLTGELPKTVDIIFSLLFIPYVSQEGFFPVYGLGWTLNFEMFFYLIFAIALLKRTRTGVAIVLTTLMTLVLIGQLAFFNDCSDKLCDAIQFYTKPILLYFAGGIVLALIRKRLDIRNRVPTLSLRVALGTAVILATAYTAYFQVFGKGPVSFALEGLICTISVALCTLASTKAADNWGHICVRTLGDASYSLYLTHSFLIGPAGRIWAMFVGPQALIPFVVLTMIGSSLLAVLSYRAIEKPLLKLLKQRWSRVNAPVSEVAP